MRVRSVGTRRDVEAASRPVREGQVLDLQVEEPHATSRQDGIARLQGYVVDIEGAAARVGQRVRVEITKASRTYARARMI
jgi:ribonuclease G